MPLNRFAARTLRSATTNVDVAAATAPSSGQVLTATSSTTATWQTPSGGSIISTMNIPPYPGGVMTNLAVSSNTTGYTTAFILPLSMTINKISVFQQGAPVANGTCKIGIYSSDGQTKHIDITTASITAQGLYSTAVASVVLSAGLYYVVVVPVSTADLQLRALSKIISTDFDAASEPIYTGTQTVTASTLPATFTPSSLTSTTPGVLIRIDN